MAYMSTFRRAAGDRRGIAMLIGIMVLAALFFMALPFAVYMRQQHSSATQALEMTRARFGQSGAVAHAKNVLYKNYASTPRSPARCRSRGTSRTWTPPTTTTSPLGRRTCGR